MSENVTSPLEITFPFLLPPLKYLTILIQKFPLTGDEIVENGRKHGAPP